MKPTKKISLVCKKLKIPQHNQKKNQTDRTDFVEFRSGINLCFKKEA